MDPVSLIVAALAAGASAGVTETAKQGVKDAYGALKSLLKRKLGEKTLVGDVIDKHEEAPGVWEKPLQDELGKTDVGEDERIIHAAQRLLALEDPAGARAGKYNVTISGGKGIIVGDHAQMTIKNGD